MAYVKQTWVDDESPLNAERMNHIEDGIEAVEQAIPAEVTVDSTLDTTSSNPVRNSVIATAIASQSEEIATLNTEITLQMEEIPDTVQTITYDSNGNVTGVVHSRDGNAVRTDTYTFGTDTVTEVRTLSTGASLTIVTNTTTLVTTVTYTAA